jgi:hypothetical protein
MVGTSVGHTVSADPNNAICSTMPAMAPEGRAGAEEVGASASTSRLCGGDTGIESNGGDAARVRGERYPPKPSWGRDDLGPRVVDPAVAQVAAPVMPRAEHPPRSPWSFPDDSHTLVRSQKDVRRLIAEILRDTRDYPIIGLTLRDGEASPALTPQEVRAVAGERTRIYLIVGHYLLQRLQRAQGTKLGPAREAVWVWWPECGARDPGRSSTFQRLAHELELSRPVVRREIERLADTLVSTGQELAEGRESNSGLKRDLRAAEIDKRRAVVRTEAAEQKLEEARAYLKSLKDAGLDGDELRMIAQMDPEDRLHRLIFREWMRLTPSDRRAHQLSYAFGVRFVATVEKHRDIPRDRLAWACAMIACRRKPAGLDVHPLRKGNGGNDSQVVRADGAKAWRARITTSAPNVPAASRLHFWIHPGGGAGVEFGSVGYHDDPRHVTRCLSGIRALKVALHASQAQHHQGRLAKGSSLARFGVE